MMVFLQAILTMVLRQAGKLLNTAFGWATSMLFGKVPEKRQLYLSFVGLSSVLWLVVVLGIAFPRVGAFLLAFIPLPRWVNDNWVRLAMLGLAVLVPPLVGFVSLFLVDPAQRPKGSERTKAILRGYPYTVGLALTLVLLIVIAPIIKVRNLFRRWTNTHVPVVVASRDYFEVVSKIQEVLRNGGIEMTRERASGLMRGPTKVFTFFAGGAAEDLVASELTVLYAPDLEILLHPSDLVISGKEKAVTRARTLVTEHLTFTKAYLTWSKEANAIEDRLIALQQEICKGSAHELRSEWIPKLQKLECDLKKLEVNNEEWEVLFREQLLVERVLWKSLAGVSELEDPVPSSFSRDAESSERSACVR